MWHLCTPLAPTTSRNCWELSPPVVSAPLLGYVPLPTSLAQNNRTDHIRPPFYYVFYHFSTRIHSKTRAVTPLVLGHFIIYAKMYINMYNCTCPTYACISVCFSLIFLLKRTLQHLSWPNIVLLT